MSQETQILQCNVADKASAQSQQLFEQGVTLHQKGQFAQAKALYEQVLKIHPQHFDATSLLAPHAPLGRFIIRVNLSNLLRRYLICANDELSARGTVI